MSNFINFDSLQGFKMNETKIFNVNDNHPLIPNSQEYLYYKKYISIHSEDRDILKYPNSGYFEIEIPEDLLNVYSVRLSDWTFPSNYNVFSSFNSNNNMTFKINQPYVANSSQGIYYEIYKYFEQNLNYTYIITIEDGFYNPTQMTTELSNKFNYAVTISIQEYFTKIGDTISLTEFNNMGGYTNFIVVYNSVSQKIWFGNKCDSFVITSCNQVIGDINTFCLNKNQLPDSSNWGLPGYVGLGKCDTSSINQNSIPSGCNIITTFGDIVTPRFYYGDVTPGDNGYWLLPNVDLSNSIVNWIECPYKINLMGPAYFYMEIEGLNCIDETSPYNTSSFTTTTNQTNGIVNSSFAKISIPTTPISQWFDRDSHPYKVFCPPAERIRRLKIKLRYHNGQAIDFGNFNYSFMLEFAQYFPQQLRATKTFGSSLANNR
jgi:hypothetical protein